MSNKSGYQPTIDKEWHQIEESHNIYVLHVNGHTLIVALYVDDLVITEINVKLILRLKNQLANTFDITDLGLLHFFLSIQILQMDDGIFLSQAIYTLDPLK